MALKVKKAKEKAIASENMRKALEQQGGVETTTTDTVKQLNEAVTKENDSNNSLNEVGNIAKPEKETPVKQNGRPKKYEDGRSKFTVYTSNEIMALIDMATKCTFSDSRSDYILKLVIKDIEQNKDYYESLYKYQ